MQAWSADDDILRYPGTLQELNGALL
jgi:hypothetical protein